MTARPHPRPEQPVEGEAKALATVAAIAAGTGALLVVAGTVAGAISGGGWGWPRADQWARIVRLILAHPGRPAAAWPAGLARRLVGAGVYWSTYACLVTTTVLSAWALWRQVEGRRPGPGRDGLARPAQLRRDASAGAARRRRQLTRPALTGTKRRRQDRSQFGYPLGRATGGGVELWASWEASTRVVGPPGEGKTFRVLARILRHHPGPALATSTKADLFELTADARRQVAVFDPDHLTDGARQVRWSPVDGCGNSVTAERRAAALLAAAGEVGDTRYGAFFVDAARDVLKSYLHAAALDGADIRAVLGWSRRLDDPTPREILRTHPEAAPGWAGIIAVHTTGAVETTSGVMRHVARALACFSHPHVVDACCPPAGQAFDIPAFLEEGGTVYLLGKDAGLGAVAPLLTAFAQEVFDTAERLANRQPGRRLDPPLLGLLDEAPSIAPIPTLPSLLADGRGRGITVVYAMQSFSQAVTRWGASAAGTMGNATNITVVFGGLSSAKDLADLERVCGTRQVVRETVHRGGERQARSATRSWEPQPVLRVADIRTLPAGVALVLWGRLPPVLARFPTLDQDPDWRTIATAQATRTREASNTPTGPADTDRTDEIMPALKALGADSPSDTLDQDWQ